MKIRYVAAGCLLLSLAACLAGCESRDDREIKGSIRSQLDLPASARFSKITYYRKGDARLACVIVRHNNGWGEPQPPMRFEAWYFFDRRFWNAGPSMGDPKLDCAQYIESELHPRPGPASTEPKFLKHDEAYGQIDDGHGYPSARLGGCGSETCSWSRVVERNIWAAPGSTKHLLRVVSGTTPTGDVDRAHVRWDAAPHEVTVECSLTHPAVVLGAQRDELQLNAAGSSIPGALNSSYALYAAECHPEAADLDPDTLARRYGYKAGGASTTAVDSVEAEAQAFRAAQQRRDLAAAASAHAQALQQADGQRARQQAMDACREAFDRVYAPYIAHPTKEGGDAVTAAGTTRTTCEAVAQQR